MMNKRLSAASRLPLAALGAALLSACTMGPDFASPASDASPSWFSGRAAKPAPSVPVAEPVDPTWWRLFNDPRLDALIERVVEQNLDLQLATIRLAESRAERGIVASAQYPSVNANASYIRQQASNRGVFTRLGQSAAGATAANGTPGGAGGTKGGKVGAFDAYQYGFDASWELDLWGKVSRSVEAADANVTSSAEQQRGALLTAIAEVARDYVDLRGAQTRLRIAHDNLRTAEQSRALVAQRAAGGLTTDLDVANAAAQVFTVASEIPRLEQEEARLINALGTLLGQKPQALRDELAIAQPIPPVPPRVPVGLPSELAERRPDIRQADAELHAATAEIGVAQANFYPSLTLSGSVGIQTLQPASLWNYNALQYAFGPALSIPIFEGGRLKSNLELRKAKQQEAALRYRQVVLRAWQEIDDAMTGYNAEQRRRAQLIDAVTQNRRALALAQSRYGEGVANFLDVLEAQRSLLITEQLLAQSTTNVSGNLVSLYKALGGGWETELPLAEPAPALSARDKPQPG